MTKTLRRLNEELRTRTVHVIVEHMVTRNKETVARLNLALALRLLLSSDTVRLDDMFGFQFDFRTSTVYFEPDLAMYLKDARLERLAKHRERGVERRTRHETEALARAQRLLERLRIKKQCK